MPRAPLIRPVVRRAPPGREVPAGAEEGPGASAEAPSREHTSSPTRVPERRRRGPSSTSRRWRDEVIPLLARRVALKLREEGRMEEMITWRKGLSARRREQGVDDKNLQLLRVYGSRALEALELERKEGPIGLNAQWNWGVRAWVYPVVGELVRLSWGADAKLPTEGMSPGAEDPTGSVETATSEGARAREKAAKAAHDEPVPLKPFQTATASLKRRGAAAPVDPQLLPPARRTKT